MTAPGFSSDRIPIRARLYLALAVSLALTPPMMEQIRGVIDPTRPADFVAILFSETAMGVVLGLLSRFYFLALETLMTSVAMIFGLGNIFGIALAESEASPLLSSFVVTCAVTLLFVGDLHMELIRGLYFSYETTPIREGRDAIALLREIMKVLRESHLAALRICSPFLLFGLIVNVALGLLARIAPNVQIYFLSGPLTIFLGIYAFSIVLPDFFSAFTSQFAAWLLRG
ncbi:flagellar biosynthetic protein FliR [Methylocystis sp. JAN1]|uniref:flagellar biosynthetic protein FliR n=1 Tax=Methylocystis sp. JAN1 TaxID=3397211 RepID=UPI003FA26775